MSELKYLIISDEPIKGLKVFGDGKIMQDYCFQMLKWAEKNRGKDASISVIQKATNIPRMNIDWILRDFKVRKSQSTLARVARIHNFNFQVDKKWNEENKYKRQKKIIRAYRRKD
jgi:hypothetical protein